MLKRIFIFLMTLMLFTACAFAEEWTYLGRYAAKNDLFYLHTTDALILNHLFPYNSKSAESHQLYDVYYFHDHSKDVYEVTEAYNSISIPINAKIVPLNIYGKPMISDGVFCGQIFSDVIIQNAGIFEVRPTAFFITDSSTNKEIFRAAGEMQGQALYADTAAAKIVEITGSHKGWKSPIQGVPLSMFQQH